MTTPTIHPCQSNQLKPWLGRVAVRGVAVPIHVLDFSQSTVVRMKKSAGRWAALSLYLCRWASVQGSADPVGKTGPLWLKCGGRQAVPGKTRR